MKASHLALGLTFALIPVSIPAVAAAEPAARRSDLASPSGSARDLGTATLAQVAEPTAAPGEPPRFTDSVDVLQPPRPATPTYTVPRSEIQQRGAQNLADVLRGQPGFAINDYGPGADIHTGTYYRGNPINNTALLLNGRPYGNNVSTYHGNTDYNSIPTEIIEKVELSSGSAATLYGSQAFGGAINIVTRKGQGPPRLKAALEYGNLGQAAYRASYGGTSGPVDWLLAYQSTGTDNVYRVPVGAANRDPVSGLLANADTFFSSYYGNFSIELDERNTLAFDLTKSLSRRGLVYFGFPLQLDRLNHDGLNLGLTWTSRLGNGEDSKLNVALGYTQDYFSTYGPTRGVFSRTGNLNTELWTARVEHNWNVAPDHNLRYGLDVVQNGLGGEVVSSLPALVPLNSSGGQTIFNGALFALDTWSIAKNLQLELGFRQNVNSRFDSTFNPNAGLRWTISPAVSLRGSWVSVQRNPGPDQLFFFDTIHGWIANPNLIPETGSSWSAGLDVDFSPGLKGQFTYFGSTLNNRLSPQFIGFAQPGNVSLSQWQNIGTVATGGGEASLRWQIAPEWSTSLALTYTDSRIVSGPESGLQFALVPFTVGQLGIGYAHEGWQVNLFANYNSGSRRALFADGQAGFRTTDFSPAYFTLDLRLRAPITESLALTAFVQNLADTPYEKVNRIFLPGLAYRFGLETSF